MAWGEQDKFPLPQVSTVASGVRRALFEKSSLQRAFDESSCGALGVERQVTQSHTQKGKHINSIIFRFPADFPVGVRGCLSCYSLAETETRTTEQFGTAVDKNEYGDIFERTGPLWCYQTRVLAGRSSVIRINLFGEVSCPVYWGLWLWFEPCCLQSRNSLTAAAAYLSLQHIRLLHEWCSKCYESVTHKKRQSHLPQR